MSAEDENYQNDTEYIGEMESSEGSVYVDAADESHDSGDSNQGDHAEEAEHEEKEAKRKKANRRRKPAVPNEADYRDFGDALIKLVTASEEELEFFFKVYGIDGMPKYFDENGEETEDSDPMGLLLSLPRYANVSWAVQVVWALDNVRQQSDRREIRRAEAEFMELVSTSDASILRAACEIVEMMSENYRTDMSEDPIKIGYKPSMSGIDIEDKMDEIFDTLPEGVMDKFKWSEELTSYWPGERDI